MDPKTIKAAKEIPDRLKQIVDSMFQESKPALRTGVSGLRGALSKIETYLEQVEKEHLGRTAARAGKKTAKRKGAKKKAKKKTKPFAISQFVLDTLKKSKKSMKAVAVAAKLEEAVPGKYGDTSGTVHNTLARLRDQKKVKRTKAGYRAV